MKRVIIFILFVLYLLPVLNSQNLVLNAGLNVSSMNIKFYELTYVTDNLPIFGPDLMLNYEYKVTRKFSIKPGLAYSRQGKKSDTGPWFRLYEEYKYMIDFIDIPLLLTYNFNTRYTRGYSINLNAGPYFGFGVNGIRMQDVTAIVSKDRLFIGDDAIQRNDYGVMFMAGFGFPENQVAVYGQFGFKNLATTDSDYTRFSRIAIGINYVRFVEFGAGARKMLKKRLF